MSIASRIMLYSYNKSWCAREARDVKAGQGYCYTW